MLGLADTRSALADEFAGFAVDRGDLNFSIAAMLHVSIKWDLRHDEIDERHGKGGGAEKRLRPVDAKNRSKNFQAQLRLLRFRGNPHPLALQPSGEKFFCKVLVGGEPKKINRDRFPFELLRVEVG